MILIDFSGISIAPIAMGAADASDENLIRHMILNSIRMYRKKYRKKYGEDTFNPCKCEELTRLTKNRIKDLKVYIDETTYSLDCPHAYNEATNQ